MTTIIIIALILYVAFREISKLFSVDPYSRSIEDDIK